MIELIIFDWDDVFTLGSTDGYYACYRKALRGVGVDLGEGEEDRRIRAKWGSGHVAQIKDLLKEHPNLVSKAVDVYETSFFGDVFVDCLSIVPGSQALLQKLARSYKLAIATGSHPDIFKKRILKKFGIPDVFSQVSTIYDIDDISHAKPHPYMVNKILETQGVPPQNAIVVGDATNDVLMARNAGVMPVVVLTGHLNKEQANKLKVKYIIDKVTDLPEVLKQLDS
jgi:phosphoglycolate phosphatase-like HAD superfamily hydrolase